MRNPFKSAPAVPRHTFECELGDGRKVQVYANSWNEAIGQIATKYPGQSLCSLRLI